MITDDQPMAVVSYSRVAELAPERPGPFFAMGYIYGVNKEYAKAEAMYARVVELKPDYLDDALLNLAVIQHRQGKTEASIKNLERAISINPENAPAQKLLEKLKSQSGG